MPETKDLSFERMPTLDEFGTRKRVIPAEVTGPLRRWRTIVHAVLLAILLILPWIKINGLQAVLLDLPGRRFEIFGVLFLSHDAPLLFFIMMLLALSLAIATALWGRVWCGWACPQTVFIDSVYRRIEIWVEGTYIKRRKLAAAPMSFEKAWKLILKWSLFFAVSSLIAHSVIAYFAGSERLLQMMAGSPTENWTYFILVSGITALLLFNFGWFREQFCIIMCPYGRFQSVLMEQHSVAVMYDEKRGDCVECNRCVQVCPTGIDIRKGIQMECISCTACIDACNIIMKKVNKPLGLIRHKQISDEKAPFLRPRVIAYLALVGVLTIGLTYNLATRRSFSAVILRATGTPYQELPNDRIINHFKLHYINQSGSSQAIEMVLSDSDLQAKVELNPAGTVHQVKAGGSVEPHFFVSFPKSVLDAKGEARFKVLLREKSSGSPLHTFEIRAVGPSGHFQFE